MLLWYVVHSKPRKEAWLCKQFAARQIDSYYPCYLKHDSLVLHKYVPYFPGYLFINVDIELIGISILQWIPGSLGLVSFGGEPAIVSDSLIQKIRHQVDQINCLNPKPLDGFTSDDRVKVLSGPFAGYSGIFDSYISGHERVKVFLEFLQQQQYLVELPVGQIALKP